jgi:hypothetical protein
VDGEELMWCGKCRRWTKGDKKHDTNKHKGRYDSEIRAAGGLAAVDDNAAEENTAKEGDAEGDVDLDHGSREDGDSLYDNGDFLQMSSGLYYGATVEETKGGKRLLWPHSVDHFGAIGLRGMANPTRQ